MNVRVKADYLLEEWAREFGIDRTGDYAAVNILDGNFALSAAGKPNPLKNRITAKETRPSLRTKVPELKATMMDGVMVQIKRVNPDYFYALKEYYVQGTIRAVAKEMGWSKTKAKQIKSAAFDMVVLLLEERGTLTIGN